MNNIGAYFSVKKEEEPLVLSLLVHSFFHGVTLSFLYVAASALFLSAFERQQLPYIFIGSALILPLVGSVYSKCCLRFDWRYLLPGASVGVWLVLVLLYLGTLWVDQSWIFFVSFLAYYLVSTLSDLEFWGLTGSLLNIRQSKRLYGLIGVGDLCARLIGYLLIPSIVHWFNTQSLIGIAMVASGINILVLWKILQTFHPSSNKSVLPQRKVSEIPFRSWLQNNYVRIVIAYAGLATICQLVLDFRFLDESQQYFGSPDKLANFFGLFFGGVTASILMIRGLASSWVIGKFGVYMGLLAEPGVVLVIFALFLLMSLFSTSGETLFILLALTKFMDECLNWALTQTVVRISYQPVSAKYRKLLQVKIESWVRPVATGLTGGAFLLIQHFSENETFLIQGLFTLLLLIWAGTALLFKKNYQQALIKAVNERSLAPDDHSYLQNPSTLHALEKALDSSDEVEVLSAIHLLTTQKPEDQGRLLLPLIWHSSEAVRLDVAKQLQVIEYPFCEKELQAQLIEETSPQVQGQIIRTLASICEDPLSILQLFLDSDSDVIKQAAVIGLIQSGGVAGIVAAGVELSQWVQSESSQRRIQAATSLEEIGISKFYHLLIPLLQDSDPDVQSSALDATKVLAHPKLIDVTLSIFESSPWTYKVNQALIAFGEPVVPKLTHLWNQDVGIHLQHRILSILGKIGGVEAIAFLKEKSFSGIDEHRHSALEALIQQSFSLEKNDRVRFQSMIPQELENLFHRLELSQIIRTQTPWKVLAEALEREVQVIKKRLFLLLTLGDETGTARTIEMNLQFNDDSKKAYALEALEFLLESQIRPQLIIIFESTDHAQMLKLLTPYYALSKKQPEAILLEILKTQFQHFSVWTIACALYMVGVFKINSLRGQLEEASWPSEKILTETCHWSLKQIRKS